MKIKVLYFFILSTISFNIYSQEFRYGIKIGSVFFKQSLVTESKSNIIGVSYNRIGGLPYDVNTYTGYNFGANLELSFKLFPDDYDKRIKSYLGLRSGINYSAQGVIVEDSNRTSFTNKLDYLQIPILINFRMNNFNFFIGPQIGNILNVKLKLRHQHLTIIWIQHRVQIHLDLQKMILEIKKQVLCMDLDIKFIKEHLLRLNLQEE